MVTQRAPRRLAQLRAVNEEARHIEHFKFHVRAAARDWKKALPSTSHGPVPLTLCGPWKNREATKILAAWGVPENLQDLDMLVLLTDGGWGVFEVPHMADVYAFLGKTAKHPDAITYLVLLAKVGLFSQLMLSEALRVVVECARLDRLAVRYPRESANEWAAVAVLAVDVWQARTFAGGVRLGDVERCSELMGEMRTLLAERQIAQLELDLVARRAALLRRVS